MPPNFAKGFDMSNGVAVAKPPIVVLREKLHEREAEIKAALADSGISPAAIVRAIITAATVNPEILACSFQSIWKATMLACRDQLLPDNIEGAFVAYKGNLQWIPMVQGLMRRFRRSGQFHWSAGDGVRTGEEFHYYVDERGAHFKHVPGDDFDAPVIKAYAAAITRDHAFFCAVLTMKEIAKIRTMSKASRDDAPWNRWFEPMCIKTALRRLSKTLPSVRD